MPEHLKKTKSKHAPLRNSVIEPPVWFGWLAVAALFLLPFPTLSSRLGGDWLATNLSPGEWLLLPLGVLSLTLGLLTLSRLPERTVLPLWLAAIFPGVLWIFAELLAMFKNGMGVSGGDLLIAWTVRLIFPTLVFLPLLTLTVWRDRLYWALTAGIMVNVAMILVSVYSGGAPRFSAFDFTQAGFLENQHDYGLYIALGLPLLAGWRGGDNHKNPALVMLFCMFLLPALALGSLFSGGLMLAAALGLVTTWAVWRGHAWILGIFLCLLVLGYGSSARSVRDRNQRVLLAATLSPINPSGGLSLRLASFDAALAAFIDRPFLGSGPDAFFTKRGNAPRQAAGDLDAPPWYASILGASGLFGLLTWFMLLAELFSRAVGRKGKSCMNAGGIAGAAISLAAAGIWTNVLAPGAGALVGLLLAVSMLDEPEDKTSGAKHRRRLASDSIVMRRTRIMERVNGKSKDSERTTVNDELAKEEKQP